MHNFTEQVDIEINFGLKGFQCLILLAFDRLNKVNGEATRKAEYKEIFYLAHVNHVIGI